MTDPLVAARQQVAGTARDLAATGLLIGPAGNVSLRVGDQVAITASGLVLGECTPDDVVLVDLDARGGTDGIGAGRTPSSELGLHLSVYASTGAGAVVHTHAPHATAVSCVFDELPVLHYQQLTLGGAIRVAPYATFGTPELAAAVTTALDGRQGALMANHGAVTIGTSLAKAADNALLLEWLAALHLRAAGLAAASGRPLRVLTEAEQVAVVEQAIALNYGSTSYGSTSPKETS